MDNLSHTLAGFVLARAGGERATPLAAFTLVVASNLPDVDALLFGRMGASYLEHHRGITHSFLGIAIQAAALGVAVWAFDVKLVRRGARLVPLLLLSLLGLLLHLGFDALNNYGVRPLLPFSPRWFYGDLVFIADPWFWLLLGGGIHVTLARTRARELAAWCLWAGASAIVLGAGMVAPGSKILWVSGLALLGALRATAWLAGIPPIRARATIARLSLAALALYLVTLAWLHGYALRLAHDRMRAALDPAPFERLAVLPAPASPWTWTALCESGGAIVTDRIAIAAEAAQPPTGPRRLETNLDRPEVQAALRTPAGHVARRFHRYLFAEVRPTAAADTADGEAVVALRDARFAAMGHDGWCTLTVRVPRGGEP